MASLKRKNMNVQIYGYSKVVDNCQFKYDLWMLTLNLSSISLPPISNPSSLYKFSSHYQNELDLYQESIAHSSSSFPWGSQSQGPCWTTVNAKNTSNSGMALKNLVFLWEWSFNLAWHIRNRKQCNLPFVCVNQKGIVQHGAAFSVNNFAGEKEKKELRYLSEVNLTRYKDPVMAK